MNRRRATKRSKTSSKLNENPFLRISTNSNKTNTPQQLLIGAHNKIKSRVVSGGKSVSANLNLRTPFWYNFGEHGGTKLGHIFAVKPLPDQTSTNNMDRQGKKIANEVSNTGI